MLGSLYLRTGDYEEALRTMEQVSWFEEDETKRAVALSNLGVVALAKRDDAEAERLFRESLAINEKLGNKDGQAADLADLSDVVRTQGNAKRADEMLQRALKLYVETGHRDGQSNVHSRLGGGRSGGGRCQPPGRAIQLRRSWPRAAPTPDRLFTRNSVLAT